MLIFATIKIVNMEIKFKDTTDLAEKVLKINDVEVVAKAIEGYGNIRAAASIEKAWRKARNLYGKYRNGKYRKLRNITLDWNQEQDFINKIEFTDWFSSVEDQVLIIAQDSQYDETRDALMLVIDEMYSRIGNIRIDRRNLFKKRAEEEKRREERDKRSGTK